MTYRNRTEQVVMDMIKSGEHVWEKLSQLPKLDITLVKSSSAGYAIYVNGCFNGAFVTGSCIDIDEAKAVGIKVKGKMVKTEETDKVLTEKERKKKKRAERKAKREQKESLFNEEE